jgi:Tfp pilus assembly protein FimV
MEPAAALAAAAAALCGLPLAIAALRRLKPDPSRWVLRVGGISLAMVALRFVPAAAQVLPPAVRWEQPSEPAPGAGSAEAGSAAFAHTYRVRPGDSLWAIACRALRQASHSPADAEVDRYWRAIYAANRSVVGEDPDLILPGQVLELPAR